MAENSVCYKYEAPSILSKFGQEENLFLSKFSEDRKGTASCLFWGQLKDPFIISRCLIALSNIVKSNFGFNPVRQGFLKDPIVTSGNEQIRFEAFSTCAGVYARVDILPDGQHGEFIENGTTNVDFNIPLITALSRIQKNDKLVLSVGKKEVGFHKDGEQFIERKVPLPTKWIKGLTTVQHFFSESESVLSLNKLQSVQLLRTIPAGKIKKNLFLVKRGNRYLFSPMKSAAGICIGGAHRLQLLQPLIPLSNGLTIYKQKSDQSVNIILHFDRVNFTFAISRDPFRGFSGEGAGLEALIGDLPDNLISAFDNYSYANQIFNPLDAAIAHGTGHFKSGKLIGEIGRHGFIGFRSGKQRIFLSETTIQVKQNIIP